MNVLVVDGYNIIGEWDELKNINELSLARDKLIDALADYQAYTGQRVVVVFDAQYVSGPRSKQKAFQVEIIYTKKNETADECIERIVTEYKNVMNQVYVATSDHLEQRIIFGKGALRKSARELIIELKEIKKEIEQKVELHNEMKPQSTISLNKEVMEVFEKWRRGNK